MDFTKNERLNQITENTVIIGIDIAKKKHVARAIDDRGVDITRRFTFDNSWNGFNDLVQWANALAHDLNRSHIIIGMEPTGHYWLNFAYYLKDQVIPIGLTMAKEELTFLTEQYITLQERLTSFKYHLRTSFNMSLVHKKWWRSKGLVL